MVCSDSLCEDCNTAMLADDSEMRERSQLSTRESGTSSSVSPESQMSLDSVSVLDWKDLETQSNRTSRIG